MALMTNDKNINRMLWLTFMGYITLLVVIALDSWVASEAFWGIWILQTIPLLLILPGLLTKYYRSYSWLCFLMLAYFISYVVQVYSPTRDLHDWFGLVATVAVFMSAMFASRWLQRLPMTTT
jgi:uncharacterized membrane protein